MKRVGLDWCGLEPLASWCADLYVRQAVGPARGNKRNCEGSALSGLDAVLALKETAFGLGCGGLASNGEILDMILFPQCARVKENRTILLCKRSSDARTRPTPMLRLPQQLLPEPCFSLSEGIFHEVLKRVLGIVFGMPIRLQIQKRVLVRKHQSQEYFRHDASADGTKSRVLIVTSSSTGIFTSSLLCMASARM
jgi:hypothetical protein